MKIEIPLARAQRAALDVCEQLVLRASMERAVVAGSIRRLKPYVGDLEVVAQPGDNFGAVEHVRATLKAIGAQPGLPDARGAKAPWGPRYFRARLPASRPDTFIPLDLFVVLPPAEWGVILAIRTGSAEFSQAVVTRLHTFGLRSTEGHVVDAAGKIVPCPDEDAFFAAAHLPNLPPAQRDFSYQSTRQFFGRV